MNSLCLIIKLQEKKPQSFSCGIYDVFCHPELVSENLISTSLSKKVKTFKLQKNEFHRIC